MMKRTKIVSMSVLATVGLFLTGCAGMEPAQPQPLRPVLACDDCKGLEYYGPQIDPAPDPRVQMASIITKGLTSVIGIGAGAYVATDIASTIAGAGSVAFGTNTTNTTTTTQAPPVVTSQQEVVQVRPEVVRPEVISFGF